MLFQHGLNIISNQAFVDPTTQHFFMRTAFACAEQSTTLLPALEQALPSGARVRLASLGKRPIVLMVTKEAHCLGDLLMRQAYGDLAAAMDCLQSIVTDRSQPRAEKDLAYSIIDPRDNAAFLKAHAPVPCLWLRFVYLR